MGMAVKKVSDAYAGEFKRQLLSSLKEDKQSGHGGA